MKSVITWTAFRQPKRHGFLASSRRCALGASSRPRQPPNHIAPLPRSLWDSEVVGIMGAQRIEHAPSDDASFLNLCFSGSGHGYAPVACRIGGSTTSLSAIGARRFVVLFSADDDRQFAPFAPCSLVPRGAEVFSSAHR